MVSPTPNKGMTYPAHGGAVNAWDSPLNVNFDQLDLNLGGYYPITISSTIAGVTYGSTGATASSTAATLTFPSSLAQNFYYNVTGTLAQDLTLTYPAVGSFYEIANNTTGSFTVTGVTAASTTNGTVIPQGTRVHVVSDGTSIQKANTAADSAEFYTYFGSPQGNVPGTVATVNGANTDAVWDATNQQLYLVTTTGSSVTAIWTPQIARLKPQGMLSPVNATNPVPTSDTTATTIYWTPYEGNWGLLSNGTAIYPFQFSQQQLTLTGTQAANQIYDIFQIVNAAGNPVIASGVAWSVATAGSGSRGTGAGTAQISKLAGWWVNAQTQNMTWNTGSGNTVVSVAAQCGIYLGSIFVDSVAGTVSCHRSYGQSRKWGLWNCYHRVPVYLKVGDSTASWVYATAVIRASNGNSANSGSIFTGLSEEITNVTFDQQFTNPGALAVGNNVKIGIGWNATGTFSGFQGSVGSVTYANTPFSFHASYIAPPALGVQTVTCLELGSPASNVVFSGTEGAMVLTVKWEA